MTLKEKQKQIEKYQSNLAKENSKIRKQNRKLMKMPEKLIGHGEAVFTDRVGNILERGDMICYISNNEFKVGVFVGLIEKSICRGGWTQINQFPDWLNSELHSIFNTVYTETVNREQKIAFAIMDKKGKVRKYYTDFDINLHPEGFKFTNYIVIQQPEFKVADKDIGRCLSLIDDLKDGILRQSDLEDQEED